VITGAASLDLLRVTATIELDRDDRGANLVKRGEHPRFVVEKHLLGKLPACVHSS
jgi:hypothetical protein